MNVNKDWTGNRNSIYTTLGASNHCDKERQSHDYYATEPKATELLLAEETFAPVIWECACGEGHMAKVLEEKGYQVISNGIYGIWKTTSDVLLQAWNGKIFLLMSAFLPQKAE